jgi:quercetin dioxygenase-like cupin family protein
MPLVEANEQRQLWHTKPADLKGATVEQDATDVAPDIYKVLFENERLRLLEVRMAPGAESALHAHPDYLVYALAGGKVKLTAGSGESAEVDINQGDTMWRDAEEHSALNVGETELVAIFVELK